MDEDKKVMDDLERHLRSLSPQQLDILVRLNRDLIENPTGADCYVKIIPGGLQIIRDVSQTRH